MPEILPDHVPSPRTLLAWDGTAYRPITIDAAGRVQVRGEDQLFSYKTALASTRSAVISGANGYVDSHPALAGEVWCVTNVEAYDATSPTTTHVFALQRGGVTYAFGRNTAAFAAFEASIWGGFKWLDPTDIVRVLFLGALAGDTCGVTITGYIMTLET